MLTLHILGGLTALVAGAVALVALKGGTLHRRSGIVFVYAMLIMSGTGAAIAALRAQTGSMLAGVVTFYLVGTALRTTRRPAMAFRGIDLAALLVAVTAGLACVRLGIAALNSPDGQAGGQPAPPYFIIGGVALLAAFSDARVMRNGGIRGAARIVRHLWRMCFALFIATASFFLGQAKVFPEPLRHSSWLGLPVLIVLVLMFYWLARVRFTRRFRLPDVNGHLGRAAR